MVIEEGINDKMRTFVNQAYIMYLNRQPESITVVDNG